VAVRFGCDCSGSGGNDPTDVAMIDSSAVKTNQSLSRRKQQAAIQARSLAGWANHHDTTPLATHLPPRVLPDPMSLSRERSADALRFVGDWPIMGHYPTDNAKGPYLFEPTPYRHRIVHDNRLTGSRRHWASLCPTQGSFGKIRHV
jgi:hypothetical protein